MGWILLSFVAGLALGHLNGWTSAHHTVAKECERLGAFYVGGKVYRCTAVEGRHD